MSSTNTPLGRASIRIATSLHARAKAVAAARGLTFSRFAVLAIEAAIGNDTTDAAEPAAKDTTP